MFSMPWLQLCWPDATMQAGTVVAVLIRHFGFWSLNPCRIVYVLDETAPRRRFGFAYGTLMEHSESGEERFMVEEDQDGGVWYDLLAFSRPRAPLARFAKPLARRLQSRFSRDSKMAMLRAVSGADESAAGEAPAAT